MVNGIRVRRDGLQSPPLQLPDEVWADPYSWRKAGCQLSQ